MRIWLQAARESREILPNLRVRLRFLRSDVPNPDYAITLAIKKRISPEIAFDRQVPNSRTPGEAKGLSRSMGKTTKSVRTPCMRTADP